MSAASRGGLSEPPRLRSPDAEDRGRRADRRLHRRTRDINHRACLATFLRRRFVPWGELSRLRRDRTTGLQRRVLSGDARTGAGGRAPVRLPCTSAEGRIPRSAADRPSPSGETPTSPLRGRHRRRRRSQLSRNQGSATTATEFFQSFLILPAQPPPCALLRRPRPCSTVRRPRRRGTGPSVRTARRSRARHLSRAATISISSRTGKIEPIRVQAWPERRPAALYLQLDSGYPERRTTSPVTALADPAFRWPLFRRATPSDDGAGLPGTNLGSIGSWIEDLGAGRIRLPTSPRSATTSGVADSTAPLPPLPQAHVVDFDWSPTSGTLTPGQARTSTVHFDQPVLVTGTRSSSSASAATPFADLSYLRERFRHEHAHLPLDSRSPASTARSRSAGSSTASGTTTTSRSGTPRATAAEMHLVWDGNIYTPTGLIVDTVVPRSRSVDVPAERHLQGRRPRSGFTGPPSTQPVTVPVSASLELQIGAHTWYAQHNGGTRDRPPCTSRPRCRTASSDSRRDQRQRPRRHGRAASPTGATPT